MSKNSTDEEYILVEKRFFAPHNTDAISLYMIGGLWDGYVKLRKPAEEKPVEENNNSFKDESIETTGVPSSFEANADSQ